MSEEKHKNHKKHEEHEHSEHTGKSETIQIKKDTFYNGTIVVLVVLLIISVVTSGFGFGSVGSATTNTAGGTANTGNTAQATKGGADLLKAIQDNPDLFPTLGPKDAKVTVTEFIDFQCPYCGMASGLVPWGDQVKGQYADLYGSAQKTKELAKQGKIRFVVGIMSFLGQESVYAAQAGLCANQQGKFFEMDDAIYAAQTQGENSGKFNKDKLEIIAQGISGLDQAKFKTCLENDKTLSLVQQSASLTSQFASGTPTFYVNNQQVSASWTAIQSAIGA